MTVDEKDGWPGADVLIGQIDSVGELNPSQHG
jgi:hypothetical protein